ncbi:MAG TPA: hypothetical protein VFR07_02000 [Mycobacteriales bacterium]|nr:hypothetical protein [Mycobacteriales bacterium]
MHVPRRPRRTTVLGSLGLLVGLVGGWVAGLLRAPRALPAGAARPPAGGAHGTDPT